MHTVYSVHINEAIKISIIDWKCKVNIENVTIKYTIISLVQYVT